MHRQLNQLYKDTFGHQPPKHMTQVEIIYAVSDWVRSVKAAHAEISRMAGHGKGLK